MAEGVGVEPTHGFNPVYGLAIRCITVLPALRRDFCSSESLSRRQLKKSFDAVFIADARQRCSIASDKWDA